MTLVLTLLTLRTMRPATAKYVIWPRVDQKSCFKAISTAGFIPLVVPNKLVGDEVVTDVDAIKALLLEHGADNVLCTDALFLETTLHTQCLGSEAFGYRQPNTLVLQHYPLGNAVYLPDVC